jgi:uncharacterized protein
MIKIKRNTIFYPQYIVDSVLELDVGELKSIGITHLVFDLDDTLLPRHSKLIPPDHTRYLEFLKRSGFVLMLASNRRQDTSAIADSIHAHAVPVKGLHFKPLTSYYRKVITESGTSSDHIAMIGDHLLNDVIGANRSGLTTILVKNPHGSLSFIKKQYVRGALKNNSHQT